jgi:glycosyltransferase involved in cell wall biosynthesis
MVEGLRRRGWTVDVRELHEGFPRPSADALDHAGRTLASLADRSTVLIDGLALGAMPDVLQPHAGRLDVVALVHLPLAAEVGLDSAEARVLEASERRALIAARRVIVTGSATVDMVVSLGVRRDAIAVVEPGTDPAPLIRRPAAGRRDGGPSAGGRPPDSALHMLCVATVSPGKGHEGLVRALAAARDVAWTLTCVGNLARHPATVERVRRLVAAEGLAGRVRWTGEVEPDEIEACYADADLFVLNTMRETYGMAVAEALAHGLPIVSTKTGAIGTLAGEAGSEAGLLVEPGDLAALTRSLRLVLTDAGLRRRLRGGAERARLRFDNWDTAAARMAAILEQVHAGG